MDSPLIGCDLPPEFFWSVISLKCSTLIVVLNQSRSNSIFDVVKLHQIIFFFYFKITRDTGLFLKKSLKKSCKFPIIIQKCPFFAIFSEKIIKLLNLPAQREIFLRRSTYGIFDARRASLFERPNYCVCTTFPTICHYSDFIFRLHIPTSYSERSYSERSYSERSYSDPSYII